MNHPRDVRAGRVLGRLECIFRQHVLEFDCFIGKKGGFQIRVLWPCWEPHCWLCLALLAFPQQRREEDKVRLCCTAPA